VIYLFILSHKNPQTRLEVFLLEDLVIKRRLISDRTPEYGILFTRVAFHWGQQGCKRHCLFSLHNKIGDK
jgi:hypothetical protein